MKIVHLVHGFNVNDGGKNSIDRLKPYLQALGYQIKEFDYGWVGLLGVRFGNKKRAAAFAATVKPDDLVIGHSNGCAIIALAMQLTKIKRAIFVHPALNKNWQPPNNVEKILVYYSPRDKVTWLSKLLVHHIWGEMGTTGPTTDWPGWCAVNDGMRHSEGFHKIPEMYASASYVWPNRDNLTLIYEPTRSRRYERN